MALSWSARRQLMYYGVGFLILLVGLYVVWATFFNTPATCFDGKQNGTELGVDCGGSCSLLCADMEKQPTALWVRAFDNGPGLYTLAAYVQNNNAGAGAKQVPYSFKMYDDQDSLVKEYDGITDLPPIQTVPIVAPNISVGNRTVTHTVFAFTSLPVWSKVPQQSLPNLHITQQNHSDDWTQVSVTIANNALNDAKNVTVVAVLFDADNIARAASQSLVPAVLARTNQQVIFTWPQPQQNIVRAEITVLPSF